MLDDPVRVVEAEDVDAGVVIVARPMLVAVQHDQVTLDDRALDLDALAGVLRGHPIEVVDERLLAVGDVRVVLRVGVAGEPLDRLPRQASVEHQVVELDRALADPVGSRVRAVFSVRSVRSMRPPGSARRAALPLSRRSTNRSGLPAS